MTDEQLYNMCKALAKRYKNQQDYGDLVTEGFLQCLEAKEGTDKELNGGYYKSVARRAMNDYKNLSTKSTSIPTSGTARLVVKALSKGEDPKNIKGVNDETLRSLTYAISNSTDLVEDLQICTPDHAKEFEEKQFQQYAIGVARMTLSYDKLHILESHFLQGNSLEDIAVELGVDRATIYRRKDEMLKEVCNNL